MDESYFSNMQRKENECLAWLQKADDEYARRGAHSKEECKYIQYAANCRYEMAKMSIGEERYYQQRKLQELNRRIESIVVALGGTLPSKKPKAAAPSKADSKPPQAAPAAQEEDQESVASWFKEAPKHSFADVSGMSELKDRLRECITDLHLSELKRYLNIKELHSFFFIGPPGCGKTYIIEAFAHELMDQNYKYLSLVGSDILSRYVGEAEKIVTRLFEEAEKCAPCIIFIDEVDGVCKNRSLPNLPEYAASITTAFLTGYNRINRSDQPIIFIGATNYPSQVDNAMLDRVELIRIPFPDAAARESAFARQFDGILALAPDCSYHQMAQVTEGYNYRDIERLCSMIKHKVLKAVMEQYGSEDAALEALKNGSYSLGQALFDEAKTSCLPTPKDAIIQELNEWEAQFQQRTNEG